MGMKKPKEKSGETRTIAIPGGVEAVLDGRSLTIKGPEGQLNRHFHSPNIDIQKEANSITVSTASKRRRIKAIVGTWATLIKNMITGVRFGWEARLKIVYSHFPMRVAVEGNHVKVTNFLGERGSRAFKLPENVEVRVDKDVVIVRGIDREIVGQAASVIELKTKITTFDRRIFQDGIHLVQRTTPILTK